MTVIFSIANKIEILPYFLEYYSRLGATKFLCSLYDLVDNPLYPAIKDYESEYPIEIYSGFNGKYADLNAGREADRQNVIRSRFIGPYDWYCVADLDEFHWFSGMNFEQITKYADDYCAVKGIFVDRLAANGALVPIPEYGLSGRKSLDDTYPLGSDLYGSIGGGVNKICLARGFVDIMPGHHWTEERPVYSIAAQVHHFKWQAGLEARMRDRYDRYVRQGLSWAGESKAIYEKIKDGIINLDGVKTFAAEKIGV